MFGRLGDPTKDDLVALKQDSTKILAVLTKRDGSADAARVGARKLLGPGGIQVECEFQTITGLTPSLRELDALAHVPLLSPRLREALVSKQTRPVTVQTKRTDLGEHAAAAACSPKSVRFVWTVTGRVCFDTKASRSRGLSNGTCANASSSRSDGVSPVIVWNSHST